MSQPIRRCKTCRFFDAYDDPDDLKPEGIEPQGDCNCVQAPVFVARGDFGCVYHSEGAPDDEDDPRPARRDIDPERVGDLVEDVIATAMDVRGILNDLEDAGRFKGVPGKASALRAHMNALVIGATTLSDEVLDEPNP